MIFLRIHSRLSFSANFIPGVSQENIRNQFTNGIKSVDFSKIKRIDLPTAGSFFYDKEISPESRGFIFSGIGALPVKRVCVETRVEYVNRKKIRAALGSLRDDQKLVISIGLESADDRIRNKIINKGLEQESIETFADLYASAGCILRAFVLIKPPTLSEAEAIEDAVRTADYVYKLGDERDLAVEIALKPMYIPRGTKIERLYMRGEYQLPGLWSVIEIIRRIRKLRSYQQNSIFTGIFDEWLSGGRVTANCPLCSDTVRAAIIRYSGSQNLSEFEGLDCECRATWEKEIGRL